MPFSPSDVPRLATGELDLGLGASMGPVPGLRREALLTDDFVCLVRRDHPKVRRRLTLRQFVALPHVLISPTGSGSSPVDEQLAAQGLRRRIALRIRYFLAAPMVVARSDLVLTAPRRLGELFSRHFPLALHEPPVELRPFTLEQIWHERYEADPGHRWLRVRVRAAGELGRGAISAHVYWHRKRAMPTVLVFLIDLLLAAACVELAGWIVRAGFYPDASFGFHGSTVAAWAATLTAALGCYLTGLHAPALLIQRKQIIARVALVGLAAALAPLVTAYFIWYQPIGRTGPGLVGGLVFLCLVAWRLLYGHFIAKGPRLGMVVLGTGPIERRFAQRLNSLPHTRYVVHGFIRGGEAAYEAPPASAAVVLGETVGEDLPAPPVLGEIHEAVAVCLNNRIAHAVVVGVTGLSPAQVQAMAQLQAQGVRVHTAGNIWMNVALQVPIDMVDARWVLNTFEQLDRPGVLAAKRLIDLGISAVGLLVFALMFPLLWVLLRLDSPGPFFYSQERVGSAGKLFRVYKVRTMRVEANSAQRWAAKSDDRTTAYTRLLRRLRVDEFPQFWNVIRGDMSLVGPRPEQPKIVEELERSIPYFGYRHLVKPGITGWAQIHQGYAASVDESAIKLAYDLYYVGRLSVLMDLDIILRTAFVMIARIGSR